MDALSSSLAGDWSGSVKKYYMNAVMEELGWTEFVQAPPPNWDNLLIVDDMQKTKGDIAFYLYFHTEQNSHGSVSHE